MTEKQLAQLIAAGKVKIVHRETGDSITVKQAPPRGQIITRVKTNRVHPQKTWVAQNVMDWCHRRGIQLMGEYRFHEKRKWRFDWVIEARMIAIEYEGLAFKKTAHTTSKGYTGNTDKYNTAAILGYTVFRITYLNYGTIIKTLDDFEKLKSSQCAKTK